METIAQYAFVGLVVVFTAITFFAIRNLFSSKKPTKKDTPAMIRNQQELMGRKVK